MGTLSDKLKQAGDTVRQAISLEAPSYPAQDAPKDEEKEQFTEPVNEFRDSEPNKAKTTSPEPDVGPRT